MHVYAPPGSQYTPEQYAWARERPRIDQTPLPVVGDEVFYRHDQCGSVERAEVIAMQPLDDMTDPNLWTRQTEPGGDPATLEGRFVFRENLDPWPWLNLRTAWGTVQTREARLPGATGWLPLNWERSD